MAPPPDMGAEYNSTGGRAHAWLELVGPATWQTHFYATVVHQHRPEEAAAPQETPDATRSETEVSKTPDHTSEIGECKREGDTGKLGLESRIRGPVQGRKDGIQE